MTNFPEWARWLTVDRDGQVYVWEDMPVWRKYGWSPRGPVQRYERVARGQRPTGPQFMIFDLSNCDRDQRLQNVYNGLTKEPNEI